MDIKRSGKQKRHKMRVKTVIGGRYRGDGKTDIFGEKNAGGSTDSDEDDDDSTPIAPFIAATYRLINVDVEESFEDKTDASAGGDCDRQKNGGKKIRKLSARLSEREKEIEKLRSMINKLEKERDEARFLLKK
jgi:hypothetical protein